MTSTLERPGAPTPARAPRSVLRGLRMIAESLASPLVPADYLDLFDPLRSGAALRGRVVEVRRETADAVTTVIKPGKDWAGHLPGQYIRLGIDIDGVRHWRAYSLTSLTSLAGATSPAGTSGTSGRTTRDTLISITTKAIPDGRVSTHIVRDGLTPGTLVHLDQATGDFTLPTPLPARTLFVTAGSGITPVIGMLRNHLADLPDVVHLHCAPSRADVIFADELRGYAAAGHLTLIERHDDDHGMLDLPGQLDELVPDWRERQVWVCGPTGLLDAAEAHWAAAGLPEALHVERFRPTIIEPGEGGEITFLDSDVTVDADGSTPILDAGEEAGVLMPSGCRMGICMGCVVTMRQGAVRDLRTGEITVAEPGDELPVQTCINAVAGSCDLEL